MNATTRAPRDGIAAAGAPPDNLADRKVWIKQALALFPMFRGSTEKAVAPKGARLSAGATLQGAEDFLQSAAQADDEDAFRRALEDAVTLLQISTEFWEGVDQPSSDLLWALYYGVRASLKNAEDKSPAEQTPGPEDVMAGIKLFADLQAMACSKEGSDAPNLHAMYRGPGVPHDNFALPFLRQVACAPALMPGFAAALSHALVVGGADNGLTQELRDFTWEHFAGGRPDTKDADQQHDAEAADAPAPAGRGGDELNGVPQWRIAVAEMLAEQRALLEAVSSLDITAGNNAQAHQLGELALQMLDDHQEEEQHLSADDYYGVCFTTVEAILMGAHGLSDITPAMKATLKAACAKAAEISKVLDTADLPLKPEPLVVEKGATAAQASELEADWQVIVSPPTFEDPRRTQIADALGYLNFYIEAMELDEIVPEAAAKLVEQLVGEFWCVVRLLRTGEPFALLERRVDSLCGVLLQVRDAAAPKSAGRLLATACLERLKGDEQREELALQSACFIARLSAYTQNSDEAPSMTDRAAIAAAASVIISALSDDVEPVDSVRARLESAVRSASVIFEDQPPQEWQSGVIQQRHVGKRIVPSVAARAH